MRAQLLFTPGDASRLLLAYDYVTDDTAGNARVPFPVFDTGQVGAGNNLALAALRRIWPVGSDLRKAYSCPGVVPGARHQRSHRALRAAMRAMAPGRCSAAGARSNSPGTRTSTASSLSATRARRSRRPTAGCSRTATWSTRTPNSSASRRDSRRPPIRRLQWVAGLYYFTEEVNREESFLTQFSLLPIAGGDVTFFQDVDSMTYAVFGQATYPFTDRLSATLGLRYSHDDKEADQVAINNDPADATPGIPLFPGQPYDVTADDSWDSTTGRFALDYRTDAGQLLYASVSKGFKSGIFPSQNNVIQNVGEATPPEEVWSYEIGAKTQWFEDTLRVNLAIFYMDYQDLQLFRLNPQLRPRDVHRGHRQHRRRARDRRGTGRRARVRAQRRLPQCRGGRRRQ